MSEQDISKCPVCDGVLEFSFDYENDLWCKCPNCELKGYDLRKNRTRSKSVAYFSLCMDIPLQFFLNKIAMRL